MQVKNRALREFNAVGGLVVAVGDQASAAEGSSPLLIITCEDENCKEKKLFVQKRVK